MKVNLKYFGMVSEITDTPEESFEIANPFESSDLRDLLERKYTDLHHTKYKMAINQSIPNGSIGLKENDTIAILPPFAGG